MTEATAVYRAVMLAVEERRQQLGLAMWQVDELAGTQDGYFAKALHADAPSGRQAQWRTLQLIVEALWPDGFKLSLVDAPTQISIDAPTFKRKLRHITANYNPKSRRELMAELGRRGREIQIKFQTEKQQTRIRRKAWKTRKRNAREKRRALAKVPPPPSSAPVDRGADTSKAKAPRAPAPARRPRKSAGIAGGISQGPLLSPGLQG